MLTSRPYSNSRNLELSPKEPGKHILLPLEDTLPYKLSILPYKDKSSYRISHHRRTTADIRSKRRFMDLTSVLVDRESKTVDRVRRESEIRSRE